MTARPIFFLAPAILLLCSGAAHAGSTTDEQGALVCITDKWDEKEVEKGHKLVDYAARCVLVPDDPAAPKVIEECTAKYEYMPDESWKGNGSCTYKGKDGTLTDTFEEGSHLKEYVYKHVSGTGQYEGITGGGTYSLENLTDTFGAGRYKGKMILP